MRRQAASPQSCSGGSACLSTSGTFSLHTAKTRDIDVHKIKNKKATISAVVDSYQGIKAENNEIYSSSPQPWLAACVMREYSGISRFHTIYLIDSTHQHIFNSVYTVLICAYDTKHSSRQNEHFQHWKAVWWAQPGFRQSEAYVKLACMYQYNGWCGR